MAEIPDDVVAYLDPALLAKAYASAERVRAGLFGDGPIDNSKLDIDGCKRLADKIVNYAEDASGVQSAGDQSAGDQSAGDKSAGDQSAGDKKDTRFDARLRVWVAIHYPESLVDNWEKILENNMVCCAVSPLHDRDVFSDVDQDPNNPQRLKGMPKAAHYHFVFKFDGKKSFKDVWDVLKLITKPDCHCPPPQKPYGDISTCVQYLIHYNDKTKAQYLRSDITSIGGFDVDRYFRLNSEQEEMVFDCIMSFVEHRGHSDLWDLMKDLNQFRYTADPIYAEAYTYCRKHMVNINALLTSRRHSIKAKAQKRVDSLGREKKVE